MTYNSTTVVQVVLVVQYIGRVLFAAACSVQHYCCKEQIQIRILVRLSYDVVMIATFGCVVRLSVEAVWGPRLT